ncbi:hypothetical protein [Streptacidiphilus sp. EB103A]|uniref:hypothetical protein n=1 Tax=Streptacidiphilus sp. EB103A TaxID=3156275 RepID=UPI003511125A
MTTPTLDRPVQLLGCALALLVTDPTAWAGRPLPDLVVPLFALAAACYAAAPLAARPVATGYRWFARLARHRNTAFAVLCIVLAATDPPPAWLAAVDAVLLLTYLLAVDAVAAGPPGLRLLRRPVTLLAAYGGTAAVLAAALLPTTPLGPSARLFAALALAAAGGAVAVASGVRGRRG